MQTAIDTTEWAQFPFSINGINFVSKVSATSQMYVRIMSVGNEVFTKMNTDAITDLIGDPSKLSTDELQIELDRINEGYEVACIELAGN